MKKFVLIVILICTISFSQKTQSNESVYNAPYYSSLRESNVNANKCKYSLIYTQKTIAYSKDYNNTAALANETYQLGKLDYSGKEYDDAIKSCNKSIFFKSVSPTISYASIYYCAGMCYMQNRSFSSEKISFDKAPELYDYFKITDETKEVNLQNEIVSKSKNELSLPSKIFNTKIAKSENQFVVNSKTEALFQKGIIVNAQNRTNLALHYFKKPLIFNVQNNNLEQKCSVLSALSILYKKLLDKELLRVNDYDNRKENERIKQITQATNEQYKTDKFSKLISILAIALISILSLLSLSLYKNNIIRTQANKLLEEKNRELIIAKEKVEEASNARSEFLSTVSHELRTPLNAINGITHLLLEEKPKKSQMHYLESLKFSGNYLTLFINDILEINKIDSYKFQLDNINFNLKQLLENIQRSLKELAFENKNSFTFEIDSEIPNYLIGDPTKLTQILFNLINNALKFTHNGEVIITAKLVSIFENNATVYFEVKDNGIGIPEDKIESVFESFSQGSIDINRKYGGTGLGLTIVKKLVTILGGEIVLKSEVKEGSTFSFELPFVKGKKTKELIATKKEINHSAFTDKRILVVEDNKINQMITKKMLKNKGILCEIIENGEDAIEKCKTNKYDLILMDVHLPGINGTIATQQIRKFDKTTPIVALTAISLYENRETFLSFGMNDVITKPFIPEDFYITICKYL